MPDDEVRVVEYDDSWPDRFRAEAELLEAALPISVSIQHVGSTAVPGLHAKPVIDILIGDVKLRPSVFYAKRLEPLHYRLEDSEEEGRYFFRKDPRTAHVHVVRYASWDWYSKIWFRDLLRADPSFLDDYAALKKDLAIKHRQDRTTYSKSKDAMIEARLRKECLARIITPRCAP
jgi:GrpB-like predicted nucleotidyltransferase (UPF0157 family)